MDDMEEKHPLAGGQMQVLPGDVALIQPDDPQSKPAFYFLINNSKHLKNKLCDRCGSKSSRAVKHGSCETSAVVPSAPLRPEHHRVLETWSRNKNECET